MITQVGGEVTARWENLVEARVPYERLLELAAEYNEGTPLQDDMTLMVLKARP